MTSPPLSPKPPPKDQAGSVYLGEEGEDSPFLRQVDLDFDFNNDRASGDQHSALCKARSHLEDALEGIDQSQVTKWLIKISNLVSAIQGIVRPTHADMSVMLNLTQTVRGQQSTIQDLTKLLSSLTDTSKTPNVPASRVSEQNICTAASVIKSQNPQPIKLTLQKLSRQTHPTAAKTVETSQSHPKGHHSSYRLTI